MEKRKTNSLIWVFLFWSLGTALGSSMLYPYLLETGLSVLELLVFFAIAFFVPSAFFLFTGKINTERIMPWGILATGLGYALLGIFGGYAGLAAILVLGGACFAFFWPQMNALWFEGRAKGNAFQSAIYYGILVTIGILGPVMGGLVVDCFGYPAVFVLAGAILGIAGVFSGKLGKGKDLKVSVKNALDAVSGFKTLLFLESYAMFGFLVLIFIITLEYFSDPLEYGAFLAATAFIAILLSLIFSKISDENKQRRMFIVLSSLGLGISLAFAAFASELWAWFAVMVTVGFFKGVFSPFPLAILLDKKKDLRAVMYGRELVFNSGRIVAAVISIGLYLLTGSVRSPLLVTGLCAIAFAVVFEFSKKKKLNIK